ncbi:MULTISPECIES: hypothetical protein [Cupriavidus]
MPACESPSNHRSSRGRQADTLAQMSALRLEVREMSRRANRCVLAGGTVAIWDPRHTLLRLFEQWLDAYSGHQLVVCLASAAEFGIPVHRHAERCRAWVEQQSSNAMRALYWAAMHRLRSQSPGGGRPSARRLHAVASVQATAVSRVTPASTAQERRPFRRPARLCERCAALQADARCSAGHDALRAHGEPAWRQAPNGMLFQADGYRCGICRTAWTRYRHAECLFVSWSIARTAAPAPIAQTRFHPSRQPLPPIQ